MASEQLQVAGVIERLCYLICYLEAIDIVSFLFCVGCSWRKPVGVEPTCGTKYRTTGLKPRPAPAKNGFQADFTREA